MKNHKLIVRKFLYLILVVLAGLILIAAIYMPVMRVFSNAMSPTLEEGDIILIWKNRVFTEGDIAVFNKDNKLMIRRVAGVPGSVAGTGEELREVPAGCFYVMADNSEDNIADSGNEEMGYIEEEQMIGKVVFRIWPPSRFGIMDF